MSLPSLFSKRFQKQKLVIENDCIKIPRFKNVFYTSEERVQAKFFLAPKTLLSIAHLNYQSKCICNGKCVPFLKSKAKVFDIIRDTPWPFQTYVAYIM